MNIIRARHDKNLIGAAFLDRTSWQPWDVAQKAAYGLPLAVHELSLFQAQTGRETAPRTPAKEIYFIVGRRGGKSRITAATACYQAAFADVNVLAPGEIGLVAVIANDREQAGVIISYCREIFRLSPILAGMVEADLAQEIRLKNRVSIKILTCSTAAVRGYTLLAVILEEAAFWRVEGRDPGQEIVRSLRPGLATTGGPLIAISSPYSRQGVMYEAYKRYYGVDGDILVWVAPSRVMNPRLSQEVVDRALAEDYASAKAEYLAEWRDDVAGFLDDETLDPLVVTGRRELAPQEGIRYFAFADPSGGRQDSFTLGIAHAGPKGRVLLDAVRRRVPPFNPRDVVAEFAQVLKEYRCSEVTGDRYSAEWCVASFREHGIFYRNSERDRSQLYKECLPLFTRGEAELLDDKLLLSELRGLERKTRPLGQDMITHGPGGHDDVANSACGALVLAKGRILLIAGPVMRREEGRMVVRHGPKPEFPIHPRLQYKTPEIPGGGNTGKEEN